MIVKEADTISETNTLLSHIAFDQIKTILQDGAGETGLLLFLYDASGELLLSSPTLSKAHDDLFDRNAENFNMIRKIALSVLAGYEEQSDERCLIELITYRERIFGVLVGQMSTLSVERDAFPFIKTIMQATRGRLEELIGAQAEMDALSAEILDNYYVIGFIHNLSTELAGLTDIERFRRILLTQVVEVVEADSGYIFMLDEKTGSLSCVECYPETLSVRTFDPIPLGEGLIGRVAQTSESILIDNVKPFMWCSLANDSFFPPLMCCALRINQDSLGTIIVTRNTVDRFFTSGDLKILEAAALQAASAMKNARLVENLEKSETALGESYQQTLLAMTSLLELRDAETENHSVRVVQVALRIAREMGITNPRQIRIIQLGATLHDIGKIGIADAILLKRGEFTDREHEEMQKHTAYGYDVLKNIPFVKEAALVVKYHHEKYDGGGYPAGLKGEEIPLSARIFKVADAFDVMASYRPYKKPYSYERICGEFIRCSGSHFDPQVVEAFLRIPPKEWDIIRTQSKRSSTEQYTAR